MRRFISYIADRLEAPALLHDFEYTVGKKTYWNFTVANLRLAYNAAKCKRLLLGIAAAIVCQLFGWWAYKSGKETESK